MNVIGENIYDALYKQSSKKDPKPSKTYLTKAEKYIFDSIFFAFIRGLENAFDYIDDQNKTSKDKTFANITDPIERKVIIDQKTIDELIERAGLGEEYIKKVKLELGIKSNLIAELDFYDRMSRLQTIFAESLPTGLGLRDWMDRIGKDDIMRELGLHKENKYYLENVYRTNYATAHSAGRYRAGQQDPSVIYYEYVGVDDGRQTPICKQLSGTIKRKDDLFWNTYYPPNHFQCRSQALEITESYAAIKGISQKSPKITEQPDKGFDVNPGQRNRWMKPTKAMKDRLSKLKK